MERERFLKLLDHSLGAVDSTFTVERYDVPSVQHPVIRCADGTEFFITIVHTGDSAGAPESTRAAGVPIEVTAR